MIKVYIASPYTNKGEIKDRKVMEMNVYRQMETFNELVNRGMCPMAPLLSHFQHQEYPLPWEKWMEMDYEWISVCDVVLRLDGRSTGADLEVAHAEKLGIPVVYSLKEFDLWTLDYVWPNLEKSK